MSWSGAALPGGQVDKIKFLLLKGGRKTDAGVCINRPFATAANQYMRYLPMCEAMDGETDAKGLL